MNAIDRIFWRVVDALRKKGYEMIQSPHPEEEIFFEAPRNAGYDFIRLYKADVNFRQEIVRDIEQQAMRMDQLRQAMRKRSIHLLQLQFTSEYPVDDWEDLNGQPYKEKKITVTPFVMDVTAFDDGVHELEKRLNTTLSIDMNEARQDSIDDVIRLKNQVMHAFVMQEKEREKERAVFQHGKPIFTYILMIIQVVMFLLLELSGGSSNTATLTAFGAKNNVLITEGEWWRLITPVFLHIGLTHLLFNTFALWSVGSAVERIYGSTRFLFIYFVSGVFGSIASYIFNPVLAAGASGAIFGCLGALLYLAISNRKLFFRTMGTNIIVIILINLGIGFSVTGIDNAGHLGGLVGGFLAALAVRLPHQVHVLKMTISSLLLAVIGAFGIYYGLSSDIQKEQAAMNDAANLYEEKKFSEASKRLEDYVDEKDVSAQTLQIYALSEGQLGNYKKAILYLNKLLEKHPNEPGTLFNLAILYEQVGDRQQAVEKINEAVKQDPDNEEFLKMKERIENN
ncbi:rhomboid family intramembrane serine protease [Bacillus sp. NPDC077027]|uniref:rhomboid family intramembrane serine protease n=1 Tax=Bacillus sp. NPDC077027 TaxID=3390548 RepID=UPI003CFD6D9C